MNTISDFSEVSKGITSLDFKQDGSMLVGTSGCEIFQISRNLTKTKLV